MRECRCGHDDADHAIVESCHEQIHYPSEDYPCTCPEYASSPDDALKCANCGHKKAMHKPHRVCRPSSGERCYCYDAQPA